MPYFELAGYGFDILLWIAYYTDTIASLDGCQEKCPLKNMLQLCRIGLITVAQLIILMPCAGVTNNVDVLLHHCRFCLRYKLLV